MAYESGQCTARSTSLTEMASAEWQAAPAEVQSLLPIMDSRLEESMPSKAMLSVFDRYLSVSSSSA